MKNSNTKPGDQAMKNDKLFGKFRGGADELFALSCIRILLTLLKSNPCIYL